VPIIIAPLLVLALKPLYAIFLREGAELFTDINLKHELSVGIAHYLAVANVTAMVVIWIVAFACKVNGASLMQCALIILAGLAVAMAITVFIVRMRVGLVGRPAVLVGLLVFTGGNLPIFVVIPAVLVVA
jgi:hypothetical protein